jgi:hypothetical protein
VVGDWNGDGKTTVGVYDPSTGTFYLRNENSAGAPDAGVFAYGAPGWQPVAGDWNADGITTIGVVAPNGTWYLRNENSAGAPDGGVFAFGLGGWAPVVGTWTVPAAVTSDSVRISSGATGYGSPGSPLTALAGTAVLHDMAHLAGGADADSGLMAGMVAPGVPDVAALDQLFAG